jgi:hypothetical protein
VRSRALVPRFGPSADRLMSVMISIIASSPRFNRHPLLTGFTLTPAL